MNIINTASIKLAIDDCHLRKLSKKIDETENHAEYDIRKNNIDNNISTLRTLLRNCDLKNENSQATDIISSLLLLSIELHEKELNSEKYWELLQSDFYLLYETQLDNVLCNNKYFNIQDTFDLCLEKLHSKLTFQEFKQYPSLINVYCNFISKIKDFKVKIKPPKIFPVSLLLIDDYNEANKIKGLTACHKILQCLTPNDFEHGNYYEVIYQSLNNLLQSKNYSDLKLLLNCLMDFVKIVPVAVQPSKIADVYTKVVNEIYLGCNIDNKVPFLDCLTKLIVLQGVNSVKQKKKFFVIITECLDQCKDDNIRVHLLDKVLQCFKTWIENCWFVWHFASDWKLLSLLLLMNCISSDKKTLRELQKLIISIILLSDEQKIINDIISSIENSCKHNDKLKDKMKYILKGIKHK